MIDLVRSRMEQAGYSVHERSCHVGRAWDWDRPGKGAMDAGMFKSAEEAWDDAELAWSAELARARLLVPFLAHGNEHHLILRETDISTLLDASLVQCKVWEAWNGMLHTTPAEHELARLKAAGLRDAREAVLSQVMS